MLLSDHRAYPTIPAANLGRAKAWYKEKLGLEPAEEHPTGTIYRLAGGTAFQLYETQYAGTAKNTLMFFTSDDMQADMQELRSHGVKFEEYDMPEMKTVNGIAVAGGAKAAWFKDTEGNTMALIQDLSAN